VTQYFQHALVAVGAIVTFAYGQLLPHLFAGRMPQVLGENVVAMLLGDARQEISFALLEKADDYFHGGMRHAECDHELTGAPGKESENCSCAEDGHAHGHDHHHHDHDSDHHHDHDSASAPYGLSFDPWRWINRRVHVQEHRHAEGEDARELLPWLWAACRTSPRNIQAYESSAYVLSRMLKRPHDALKLLEEGVRLNPTSAELEFSLGELALHSLKDPTRAEQAFAAARAKCKPEPGEAGEDARFLQGRILFYLGYLAHQRGDHNQAVGYLAEAIREVPEHVGTRDLRNLLNRQHEDEGKEP
jgi:tetratricopeptide (TPR) repeat protein